jgi:SAM-dependent methyltransferase
MHALHDTDRAGAYGQHRELTPVDRLGVWLSARAVRKHAALDGARLGDFGCGFDARFVRSQLDALRSAVLVDLALADDLKAHPKVHAVEGGLPEAFADVETGALDVSLCLSVLEHLWEPEAALDGLRRITRPGGVVLINVPSWRGKRYLELAAFRLGVSPAEEMDDHKRYYDPRDLWPMLVRAGFKPSGIRCYRHKGGLNTFAVGEVPR